MKSYYIEDIQEKDAYYPLRKMLIGKELIVKEIYRGFVADGQYVICAGEIPGIAEDCFFAAVKLSAKKVD